MRRHHHDEDFKEMELWEHLTELRNRLIRSLIYVIVSMAIAWSQYRWVWKLFFAPLEPILRDHPGWTIIYTRLTDGFMVQFQVSLAAGLILAVPAVTLEAWGFVAPGLTRTERRAFYLVVPLSLVFFFLGITCGYIVMFPASNWFAGFIPPNSQLLQSPIDYIMFVIKMVLAFGICFQLPLVLMFLGYIGMVTSKGLREQWRMALVLCFALGAIATPGGDPFSMAILALPLGLLYLASIFMVKFVEGVRDRREKKESEAEPRRDYAGAAAGD